MKTIEALLVTKGHPFEREPFFQMIDNLTQPHPEVRITWTHVEHPAVEALMHPERAARFDTILWYDMPGVVFTGTTPRFAHYDPSEAYKSGFLSLLDSGKPMVFLHHAISAWPSWPEFAELLGGRFHFLPGTLRGKSYPGSGYRFRVPQKITVENPGHPIVRGLDTTFELNDETYLYAVLEQEVTPLLSSDFSFTADQFHFGGDGFKAHPPGSNLVGWTKMARNAPIAYIQIGHGPAVYSDPNFRRLITNSIIWAASENPQITAAA